MQKYRIPLVNIDNQIVTTQVANYSVRVLAWRQPESNDWYCSIESPPNTKLVSGRRMTINENLLVRNARNQLNGNFAVESLSIATDDPSGTQPWGNTHDLFFKTDD